MSVAVWASCAWQTNGRETGFAAVYRTAIRKRGVSCADENHGVAMGNGDDALSDVVVGRVLPNGPVDVPPCFCFSLWSAFERPMKILEQQQKKKMQHQVEEEEEDMVVVVAAYRP